MSWKRAAVFVLCIPLLWACSPLQGAWPGVDGAEGGDAVEVSPKAAGSCAGGGERELRHVLELRAAYKGSGNLAGEKQLSRAEEEAASYFLCAGQVLAKQERYQEAVERYDLGLLAQPANAELISARQAGLRQKEAAKLYLESGRAKTVGNFDLAETLLKEAAALDGGSTSLKQEFSKLAKEKAAGDQRKTLTAFRPGARISLNFRDAKLKDALKAAGAPYSLNFVYDKSAGNLDVNVSAANVTFEQGLNMIMQSANADYKVLGPNSLLIYENTPEKKKQYEDRYFKTFHLSTLKADRMAEIIKAAMDVKTLIANNDLGTIAVRDSRDTLDVIEKLIAANDRKPAEIMLNVEILEVDRTKEDKLGLDYGNAITAQLPKVSFKQLVNGSVLADKSVVTFPTVTLNYLKSDAGARTLSNPRVRTIDGQPAKIHVGDRVPLQSASIQDATGQSRILYEYQDIGIKLDVLPKYHLDDSIFVDLNIEVSALGRNIGTEEAPAYEIGTRNVHTTMILREGETAVLAGLISDDEQKSLDGLPALASTSIVGHLFSTTYYKDEKTDLLLTITPQLVRPQSLPNRGTMDFYSGNEGSYSTRPDQVLAKSPASSGEPLRFNVNPANDPERAR
jgi:general secretion pathway protein D